MAVKVLRVIGRKKCLHCGYPVQVEGYKVDQVLKMLSEYTECGSPKCDGPRNPSRFLESKVEIVARKTK